MRIFRNERVRRVLRPVTAFLGLAAAIWHSAHALSMWTQMQQHKTSDPPLADFFWAKFQSELGVTIAAMFAGVFAWHIFKPRPKHDDAA